MRFAANAKVGIYPLTHSGVFGIAIDICSGSCYRRLSAMSRGSAKVKCVVRVAIKLAIMSVLSLSPQVYGEEQAARYSVAAWGHKDGLPSALIYSIAQTKDGFLWLGTDDGLVRFDGAQFTPWRFALPEGQLVGQVYALKAFRNGDLFLAAGKRHLARVRGTDVQRIDLNSPVASVQQAVDGSVWVATSAALWHVNGETLRPVEVPISLPGKWLSGPLETSDRREWVATDAGLFYTHDGGLVKSTDGRGWLVLEQDGQAAWLDDQSELHSLESKKILGKARALSSFSSVITSVKSDSSGCLWIGTRGEGLLRVSGIGENATVRRYTRNDGLSSDFVQSIFEDTEQNIWVGTQNGLNRLRRNRVLSLTQESGLISDTVTSIVAGGDGAVWLGTADGLERLREGQSAAYERGVSILSLLMDREQQLWAGTTAGILRWKDGRVVRDSKHKAFTAVKVLVQDESGQVWFFDTEKGLYREGDDHNPVAVTEPLVARQSITAMTRGPGGTLWFGFADGRIVEEQRGNFRTWSESDGLSGGAIHGLSVGDGDQLWVATERGLCFLEDSRFACRKSSSGLPGDRVLWALPDRQGSLWLGYSIGVGRFPSRQLRDTSGKSQLGSNFFDDADGIVNSPDIEGNAPAAFAQDGRLWLTTSQGVAVMDPEHLNANFLPPPVHILGLDADGQSVDLSRPISLRPLTRSVRFSFTGISLTVPRKVRFRYMLENFDREWHDGGANREAFYTNLPPRRYTFRVVASNNDGVWNNTDAQVTFFLRPTYYQTLWFQLLCLAAVLIAVLLVFRRRLRSAQRLMRLRFEERMEERTRIARELHDHLIQDMVGIGMQLEVADELTPGSADAKTPLHRALTLSRSAIANGRLTLESLRQPRVTAAALIDELRQTGDAYPEKNRIPVEFRVDGRERLLQPDIAEDLSELGVEALRNALKHARKGMIHIDLRYGIPKLELIVIDEGDGISEQVLQTRIPGHYGLAGMRERAARMGADLSITSGRGNGTTVHVSVPAERAYQDEGSGDGRSGQRRKQPVENDQ
jgi:signal transduction histidine kinase/ligand-binding sensor domain-containing protein